MFFALSKLLYFALTPIFWVTVLLLLSIVTRKPRRKTRYVVAGLIILYFFSNDYIFNKICHKWEVAPVRYETLGNYDYAIVLGGFSTFDTVYRKFKLSEDGDRIWQAVQLYEQKKVKKIFISGGPGQLMHPDETEADKVKTFLCTLNIPDSDIIVETKSRNTHENAVITSNWLKQNAPQASCILVTSAYHMRRAAGCFRKEGVQFIPYSARTLSEPQKYDLDRLLLPQADTFHKWNILLKEWVGYVVYKIVRYL
jgi:uncharacterized SAM-binding protein YcdF (DUF218 family)